MWRKFLQLYQIPKYRKILMLISTFIWMICVTIHNIVRTDATSFVAIGGVIIFCVFSYALVQSDLRELNKHNNDDLTDGDTPNKDI